MFAVDTNGNRAPTAKGDSAETEPAAQVAVERAPRRAPSLATIYQDAGIKAAPLGYDIVKVAEMANSRHLAAMSPETKRNALLMAIQASGTDLNFIVADTIARQRALNEYEDGLLIELKAFESQKAREAAGIQEEFDRLAAGCKARLQANLDEVERERTAFHAWQKTRQQESLRIVDTATLLVPPEVASDGESLAALLDRAIAPRK